MRTLESGALAGHGYCREGARGQAQFPHWQHSIPPIIASSTPKIPSANLLFQPHPPNTEKISSLTLLQCFREPRQRDPHSQCPATFDEGPCIEECLQRRWWSHISSYNAIGAVPRALGRGWWECSDKCSLGSLGSNGSTKILEKEIEKENSKVVSPKPWLIATNCFFIEMTCTFLWVLFEFSRGF
jgi:hypothetical protein